MPSGGPSGRPLWNHNMPSIGYTMYSSDYLYRIGYSPTVYDPTTAQPGLISKQCLSCHDGTIAIGGVYAVKNTILGTTLIAMTQSGTPITTMPTTATGFIGGNLMRHHPVGIVYNSTIPAIAFGVGSRSIELVTSPSSSAMKLYNIGGANYVECASCHDPHTQNQKFLRDPAGVTLAAKIGNTCNACHNKIGWTTSVHQSSTVAYSDAAVNTTFGANTIASLACMNCHRTHKGLGASYLLRQAEETTCFQGASGLTTETACHGSSSSATTNRIRTAITRLYQHPTTTISGIHTDLDVLYPTAASKGLQWSDSRHAECVDCHNPHRATNTPARVGTASWYPTTVTSTSNLTSNSGALTGVTGVEPTWPAIWTVPTTFTTQESSTKEYQICFKCHSWYALRDADGITLDTTVSGAVVTDQSMEFNPNNKAAHPVAVTLNNMGANDYIPKPLVAAQMVAPWATNVGNQTMYCSDCHGTDNEASGDPKGPHGSSFKYLLKGTGKYWPFKSDGTLWRLNTTDGLNTALFCKNCHPVYDGSWKNNGHSNHGGRTYNYGDGLGALSYPCVGCHSVIPHGTKRSRLIVYRGAVAGYPADPTPYRYQPGATNYALLSQFKKTTAAGYAFGNCNNTGTCAQHSSAVSGADP